MDNAFLRKMKKIKAFLLDLDGTVYIEGELIGDMKNTLAAIRASGRKIVYLTNNSSKTGETYVERLKNIGIWDGRDRVYTSGDATIAYLKNNFADRRVYLMGTSFARSRWKSSAMFGITRVFISRVMNVDLPERTGPTIPR